MYVSLEANEMHVIGTGTSANTYALINSVNIEKNRELKRRRRKARVVATAFDDALPEGVRQLRLWNSFRRSCGRVHLAHWTEH